MMQIGELAKRVGVSTQTIRYYERIGLLGKTARSPSGYRLYSEETERFLRFLKKAQKLGFTLREIKAIWEIRATGRKPCGYVKQQAEKKVLELTQKIKEFEELRQILIEIQKDWDTPKLSQPDETRCVCPLIEGTQILQQDKRKGG
ncbi:heavy metal-responsive transcriptional regulator [Desulfoferrobacter suflitae]|jgi:DNA-binding transcriptional MerR regulator|uniref:heavy metal-responsive transcriptional regulator n=1 Tax=Desulfoferrobacter suflitae TaxID=2865782 RepID=UPI002164B4C2|nr:heavy metal-responsive transcriptional regulator [Desulfoferrobacter suflitae]MCK8604197.1 heavy metal-responsive transcriptional regulator [Desulfoferrobacter suflitae]MDD3815869.1 heavy metal-responsive transcriptional regulator [Desulfocapsaceae bacterium]